jgi:hypothetical protein
VFVPDGAFLASREMALERAGGDAGFGQLLGRAGGRRTSFDVVAVAFGRSPNGGERRRFPAAGDAFERDDLVAAGEQALHGRPLMVIERTVFAIERATRLFLNQRRMALLPHAHHRNGLGFEREHLGRCEGSRG